MMRLLPTAALVVLSNLAIAAQPPPPPPSTVLAEPAWSRTVHLEDGRTFVTDGGLALIVAVARPKTMPRDIQGPQAAKALAGHLALVNPTEVRLDELKPGAKPNTFVAANGIAVNGNYIAFLRRAAPRARLRVKGLVDPIVLTMDDKVIGVFMPLKP